MRILGKTPSEIISATEQSVGKVCELLAADGEGRSSGYFTLLDVEKRAPILIAMIGDVPVDKIQKYRSFSLEKAVRLAGLMFTEHHQSSWQSRNPDEDKWGGAITIAGGTILSFSGLPELADEAAMLDMSINLHVFGVGDRARKIAQKSNNTYFFRMYS